ncbi:MAG: acyltransferase family protein [Clostridia bacterium]|nr:acyltransferase family protein [Clostridia bacterium]
MTDDVKTVKANERSRIIYFDVLRIMAIFFVVVLHVSAENWYDTDINSFEWRMMNLFDGISRWGVPIFVMISGALFLDRNITMKQLYGKYILRLALSFVVWSFGYAVVWYAMGKDRSIASFVSSFIKGHYHLWFIYMIIGLYIITPMLNRIVSDEKLLRYFLILSFVFAIVIPEIISIITTFNAKYGDWAESVINQAYL